MVLASHNLKAYRAVIHVIDTFTVPTDLKLSLCSLLCVFPSWLVPVSNGTLLVTHCHALHNLSLAQSKRERPNTVNTTQEGVI